MIGVRRIRRVAPDQPRPWSPLLLDQCGLAAVAEAAPSISVPTATTRRQRKRPSAKRGGFTLLRVAMLALGLLTVVGLAVGVADISSGGGGLTAVARLALLALVATGLVTQFAGLVRMIPGVRSLRLPRRASPRPTPPLLLDQVPLSAIGEHAAPVATPGARRRASRLTAAGTWFALAIGVVIVLLVAVVGALASLVVIAVRGNLLSPAGAMAGGISAMLAVGLWAMVRMVVRSIEESRLRRRKRALRQLLRALLQWLLRGGRRSGPVLAGAGVNAALLCLLAAGAVAVGIAPAVFGGGDDDTVAASAGDDDGDRTKPTATPTPTPTRRAGSVATATATGSGGGATSGASGGEAQGGDGTQTPGSTSTRGPGTATPTPGRGTPTAAATATGTSAPTQPGATPTPTRTPPPGSTPTPTPTTGIIIEPPPFEPPTPTPRPPTATPTTAPKPTSTPTPIPPTPTPTPKPTCQDDADCDGWTDSQEIYWDSLPNDPNSTPGEHPYFPGAPANVCADGKDNDNDGKTDQADLGCQSPI